MNDLEIKDSRKVSDVLISLEEKVILLIKTIAANDMNNKLILDRLNKLLNQGGAPSATADSKISKSTAVESFRHAAPQSPIEVNQEPIKTRKQVVSTKKTVEKQEVGSKDNSSAGKIPVGQRITDGAGKDLFMADVQITNMDTNETIKVKTNAVGKWQAYLGVGNYSVHVSKIIDANTLAKLESLQEIEVTSQMKSLQLPIIIIKR